MDPIRNPYLPSAGAQPPELAGRQDYLDRARIALERVRIGRPERGMIAVGLRGVGKTVLLIRVRRMADELGYRTALIEVPNDQRSLPDILVPQLRRILLELDHLGTLNNQVRHGLRVLRGFMSAIRLRIAETELSLDLEPVAGTADSGDLEVDLPDLFLAIGRAAAARQTSVALFIDEIQYLSDRDFSALIMAMHRIAQEAVPIVLMAAGLPQAIPLAGKSKSYAERLFEYPAIGALSRVDAEVALAAPAKREGGRWTSGALDRVMALTKGYPYFLQEWGHVAWDHSSGPAITSDDIVAATPKAVHRLDESFFQFRFDRLTPRERDYLRAMAELGAGPHRSGEIADRLEKTIEQAGPLRTALINKGMIYAPGHGETAFTVPMFDEYLRRVIKQFEPPPTRGYRRGRPKKPKPHPANSRSSR